MHKRKILEKQPIKIPDGFFPILDIAIYYIKIAIYQKEKQIIAGIYLMSIYLLVTQSASMLAVRDEF